MVDRSDRQVLQHVAVLDHELSTIIAETVLANGDNLKRGAIGDRKASMRIVATIVFVLGEAVLSNHD